MYAKIVTGIIALTLVLGGIIYFMRDTPSKAVSTTSSPLDAADVLGAFAGQGQNSNSTTQTAGQSVENASPITTTNKNIMHATFHTNKGDFVIEFMPALAPNTVANFVKLAGAGFYDGVKFHRVIKGFMIQGGDPFSKDDAHPEKWGMGGPGYTFKDELGPNNHDLKGTIAMANSGPDTNGSQFFVNVADNNFLDSKHVVFGKIVSGMEVVNLIENVKTGASDRPVEPVVINSITLK